MSDFNISCMLPTATIKTYKLTVPATTKGIDSYSVTITKGSLGTMPSGWTSGSKVSGITFSLSVTDIPYGSSYVVEYISSQGYTISKTKDSGNFDRDIACALPTATLKTFNFTINQSANQTITVTTGDGVRHTSSFVAKYGTTWTAQVVANSGYKAGTLSATSGTVTGAVNVSATEAKQDYLFYDIVRFKVDYWSLDNDEMGTSEEGYGYGDANSGVDSVARIKLSFGYLQAATCEYDYESVLCCPIYVPDNNIKNMINGRTISVWFDDYPVVWSRPIGYYSYYPNSIYSVWAPYFPFPGCSTANLDGLFNFMRSKYGQEVTLHIKVE